MQEPLSEKLRQIIEANANGQGVTLNHLLEKTGGRGFYLVLILLSLPFILPMALPGVSTVLGLSIALLSIKLAVGATPRLPQFMGERSLSPAVQHKILTGSARIVGLVEKLVHPRRTLWLATRSARTVNALLLAFMALLLALPFPPFPPLTNSLPCYCIILLSASMMEEDGVAIWWAYLLCLGTTVYLGLNIFIIVEVVEKVIELIRRWLGS
jgi:hypothetical protein